MGGVINGELTWKAGVAGGGDRVEQPPAPVAGDGGGVKLGGEADEVGMGLVRDGGAASERRGRGGAVEAEREPGEEDEEGEEEWEGRRPLQEVQQRRRQGGVRRQGGGRRGERRRLRLDVQRDGSPRVRHRRSPPGRSAVVA